MIAELWIEQNQNRQFIWTAELSRVAHNMPAWQLVAALQMMKSYLTKNK